jgi:phenylacetate-coenzyme A ligase PaaK-like adenylate-forming protein
MCGTAGKRHFDKEFAYASESDTRLLTSGSKLPQHKAQASLRTPKGLAWSAIAFHRQFQFQLVQEMIYDWKMELYWHLPVYLQEAGMSLYAGRLERLYYGPGFEEWRRKCQKWQNWSRTDAETWQSDQLRSVMTLAATRVPYYREQWKNLDYKSVRSAADLRILPRLDKQAIRLNEQAFLVEGLNPKSLWMEKTSGTTGTSLRIYWPMSMLPKFWAVMEVMVRNIAGVGQDIPRAVMGGRPIVRGSAGQPPFWRFNRRWRQLYLSSYHVSPDTAEGYIGALQQYGSQWMTGYGSAIAALTESALGAAIQPFRLGNVIVSGDTLLPGMRLSIERFFQSKCFDHYGQCEGVAMAMECRNGQMHVIPAIGVLEILREDGTPCVPGETGEMVATGLLNDAMPLIRYRLGDYAAWAETQNCECGNPQPILTNLEGRVDDYLIARDGRKIGRLSTAVKRSPTIHSAQIVQDEPGHAFLLVRPGEGYRSADSVAVRDDIHERIGSFSIEIVEVSEIPKTRQGKTSLVVRLADRPGTREIYEQVLNRATNDTGWSTPC